MYTDTRDGSLQVWGSVMKRDTIAVQVLRSYIYLLNMNAWVAYYLPTTVDIIIVDENGNVIR